MNCFPIQTCEQVIIGIRADTVCKCVYVCSCTCYIHILTLSLFEYTGKVRVGFKQELVESVLIRDWGIHYDYIIHHNRSTSVYVFVCFCPILCHYNHENQVTKSMCINTQ